MMATYQVPSLPVLTTKNTKQYPRWHTYVERVYGQSVSQPIDLNTFTWFYYYAPFDPPVVPRKFVDRNYMASDTIVKNQSTVESFFG